MKVRYFVLATCILILIIGIVSCSKHEPKNLRYEIADAANDYFGDGRFSDYAI